MIRPRIKMGNARRGLYPTIAPPAPSAPLLVRDDATGFWNILWTGTAPSHWQEWKRCDTLANWTQQGQIAPGALPVANSAVLTGNEVWWEVKFVGVDGGGIVVTPYTNVVSSPFDTAEIHDQLSAMQGQITALQTALNAKPSTDDVNAAITANSSANVNSVDTLDLNPSDPPTQNDVYQAIYRLNVLILGLHRQG